MSTSPQPLQSPRIEGPLADAARGIVARLAAAGHEALFVGGCVRDGLLGLPVEDIDIATDAPPERIATLFPEVRLVGASFGVCLVRAEGHEFEVATYRKDGRYVDHRRPESVEYGTQEEDTQRRDFTVNALYYHPQSQRTIDRVGGRDDLAARRIRTVGEPSERFAEDALRLLRAIRFAARLDFEIEARTWDALRAAARDIAHVSAERVREELTLILLGAAPARAFRLLDASGLLAQVLPEVAALKGVEQSPEHHPEGDVFVHTLLALEHVEPRTPVACWAALLHDIGKPATAEVRPDGRIGFFGHEKLGAEMAEAICRRLRFSNDDTRRITEIVARHMRFINARQWRTATMRRFLSADTIEEDLAVHRADCLASHGRLAAWELVSGELERLRERREPPLPPPLLTGHDLIEAGLQPGPGFRQLLERAQDLQMEGELTSREEALRWLEIEAGRGSAGPS